MTGHLGRDMRAQPPERPAGQVLQVASGVLHFVEGPFDPFPQTVKPTARSRPAGSCAGWRARGSGSPGPGSSRVALLPVDPEEALVAEDAGPPRPSPAPVPRPPLVPGGRHQVVGCGHPPPAYRAAPACRRSTSGCGWRRPRRRPWPQSRCGSCHACRRRRAAAWCPADRGRTRVAPKRLRPASAQGLDPGPQLAGPAGGTGFG